MSYANRPLNRQDYKTLTLAALGGALEFYDFIIFVFFAAVVGEYVDKFQRAKKGEFKCLCSLSPAP